MEELNQFCCMEGTAVVVCKAECKPILSFERGKKKQKEDAAT